MPYPRHVLQSVTIPVVTQVRVSDDYTPGNDQWRIGVTTILAHAVGLAAFKDVLNANWDGSPAPFPPPLISYCPVLCVLLKIMRLIPPPLALLLPISYCPISLCLLHKIMILKPPSLLLSFPIVLSLRLMPPSLALLLPIPISLCLLYEIMRLISLPLALLLPISISLCLLHKIMRLKPPPLALLLPISISLCLLHKIMRLKPPPLLLPISSCPVSVYTLFRFPSILGD